MYLPLPFQETDVSQVKALMANHPLATLVLSSDDGLLAEHIPLLLHETADGRWLLQGHVARGNNVWRLLPAKALVIFHGPDCYISAGFYPSKQRDGKVVPTWNYVALHLQGELRAVDDGAWLRDLLTRLTAVHEQAVSASHGRADSSTLMPETQQPPVPANAPRPWQLTDAPADYIDKLFNAVVGIEFEVSSWQCKAKVSQNQSAENQQGVIAGLTAAGATPAQQAVAHWVQQGASS